VREGDVIVVALVVVLVVVVVLVLVLVILVVLVAAASPEASRRGVGGARAAPSPNRDAAISSGCAQGLRPPSMRPLPLTVLRHC